MAAFKWLDTYQGRVPQRQARSHQIGWLLATARLAQLGQNAFNHSNPFVTLWFSLRQSSMSYPSRFNESTREPAGQIPLCEIQIVIPRLMLADVAEPFSVTHRSKERFPLPLPRRSLKNLYTGRTE